MNRIAVIGNAGGGKTTMSRRLSQAWGIPYYAIDDMQWRPGWEWIPEDEFRAQHDAVVATPMWVIDGFGSWPSIERRLAAADTIVLLDHSIWVHLRWTLKRQFRSLWPGGPSGPAGCPLWQNTLRVLRVLGWFHLRSRDRLIESIRRHAPGKKLFHLRSPAALDAFVAGCTSEPRREGIGRLVLSGLIGVILA